MSDLYDRTEQCQQWIATPDGSRQCSRRATYLTPDRQKGVCTQHARSYDTPKGDR